jgi:hypothetical protein
MRISWQKELHGKVPVYQLLGPEFKLQNNNNNKSYNNFKGIHHRHLWPKERKRQPIGCRHIISS